MAVAAVPEVLDERRPEREIGLEDERGIFGAPIEAYKKACARYIREGHTHAYSANHAIKERFRIYRQRRTARYGVRVDDQRLYRAMVTKLIGTMKANILPELVQNPYSNDWLEMKTHAPGHEPFFRDVEAVLRHKFHTSRPETDGTFYETVDSNVDDYLTYGSTIGIVRHEILEGDVDGNGIITQQPEPERISVFNFWPWSVNVDSITQTNCTVWAPLTDDELDNMGYVDPEQIRKNINSIMSTEDNPEQTDRQLDRALWPDITSNEKLWPSFIYYGRCPWRHIVNLVEDKEVRDVLIEAGKEAMYEALAIEYGFDPMDAAQAEWWCGRLIGKDDLAYFKPWSIRLPQGHHPVIFEKYIKVPGQLWGMGLYDIGGTDEEAHNRMNVAAIKMSELCADPPLWYQRSAIDQIWLQEQGGDFEIRPGIKIPINEMMEKEPIKALTLSFEIIDKIMQQSGIFEGQLRTLVGVSSDIEGDSSARTATQNVNNVQFGLAWLTYTIKRLRAGLMYQYAVRAYLAMQQSMREIDAMVQGVYEIAPTGYVESRMKTAAITAQHMIDMSWVTISITGPNEDASRIASVQQKLAAYQAFVATQPLYNSHEGMLDIYKSMRVPDYRKFSLATAGATQLEIASSIAASGMTLPPEYQMELGIPPMLPPPVAAPGEEGPPEQDGTDRQQNTQGSPEPPQLPMQPNKNYETTTFRKAVGTPAAL